MSGIASPSFASEIRRNELFLLGKDRVGSQMAHATIPLVEHLGPSGEKELNSRIEHYESVARGVMKKYGREFRRFARKEKRLAELGDHLLSTKLCTGYNILLDSSAMLLDSEEKLIFYSNYIGRIRHFGTLLAIMEKEGLMTEGEVSYGAKASRILYDESWGISDPQDEKIVEMEFGDVRGNKTKQKVDESVETVLTIKPEDEDTAVGIVNRLFELTKGSRASSLDGSWLVPDIRATVALKPALVDQGVGFKEVVANVFSRGKARLVSLRQSTRFSFPWESFPVAVNNELERYLTGFDIAS